MSDDEQHKRDRCPRCNGVGRNFDAGYLNGGEASCLLCNGAGYVHIVPKDSDQHGSCSCGARFIRRY